MAINVNNMIVVSKSIPLVPKVAPVVPTPREEPRNLRSSIRRNAPPIDMQASNSPHMVVDGKVKRIGKTSAYMLDMLAFDD